MSKHGQNDVNAGRKPSRFQQIDEADKALVFLGVLIVLLIGLYTLIPVRPDPEDGVALTEVFHGGTVSDASGALVHANEAGISTLPEGSRYLFAPDQTTQTLSEAPNRSIEQYFAVCLPGSDGNWISRPAYLQPFAENARRRPAWSRYPEMIRAFETQNPCASEIETAPAAPAHGALADI